VAYPIIIAPDRCNVHLFIGDCKHAYLHHFIESQFYLTGIGSGSADQLGSGG